MLKSVKNTGVIFGLLALLWHSGLIAANNSSCSYTDTTINKPYYFVGADYRPGYIFQTADFLRGENGAGKKAGFTQSGHLKFGFKFNKNSHFGQLYPYAYQGIGVSYNSFNNTNEIGNPIAVYIFQGSKIANITQDSKLTLGYEWNFGISFGWKKFNNADNPFNTVIGSKANAYINLAILFKYRLNDNYNFTLGIDGTHFSNGNTQYPNRGLNTIGVRIGAIRQFGKQTKNNNPNNRLNPNSQNRENSLVYDFSLYGAIKKKWITNDNNGILIPGKFGVAGLNINPLFCINRYFKTGLSFDAQYDESANIREYLVEGSDYSHESIKFYRQPFSKRFSAGISARAEVSMPIFSVNFGVGYNIIHKGDDTKGFYQVLALKAFVSRQIFLHVGYQLKNFKDPNNLMIGIGYRIGK